MHHIHQIYIRYTIYKKNFYFGFVSGVKPISDIPCWGGGSVLYNAGNMHGCSVVAQKHFRADE